MPKPQDRWLIGRTIVAIRWRPFHNDHLRCVTYDPIFVLDNGAELAFMAIETSDEYGVDVVYRRKPARKGEGAGRSPCQP